jgi:hypothetical protein
VFVLGIIQPPELFESSRQVRSEPRRIVVAQRRFIKPKLVILIVREARDLLPKFNIKSCGLTFRVSVHTRGRLIAALLPANRSIGWIENEGISSNILLNSEKYSTSRDVGECLFSAALEVFQHGSRIYTERPSQTRNLIF